MRLTLLFVVVATLSAALAALFLTRSLERHITDQIADGLLPQIRLARDLTGDVKDLPAEADALADRLGSDLRLRVTVIASDGRVLGDTDLDGKALESVESHAGRPEVAEALRSGRGRAVRYSTTLAENMLYVAERIDPRDPGRGVLRLAVPLTAVRKAQQAVRSTAILAAMLSTLFAGLFGYLAARGPSRRLEAMSRVASELAAGRPGARAVTAGRDEIAHLAQSLNRMADQQEERLATLSRERNRMRTLLDGMVEGVLLTDATGLIVLANGAFVRIFAAEAPVEGKRPLEAARVPALQEAIEAALGATEPLAREFTLGAEPQRVIHASLAAVREAGRTVGAVAVFHDVTELERLERVRREFVANVSHELRTPLTAIKGYAETLRDGGLEDPAVAAEFVGVIHRHAARLGDLIEDLLDLSSIEQGRARLAIVPVPVGEVVAQAEAVVRAAARERAQTFEVAVPAGLPAVRADRDRLAQVLINLLDNAVKFTPDGGRVRVSAEGQGARVVIAVSDTGPGIPPGEQARIFERFYRLDRSRDRQQGGTGLGLAIAKHLTLAMGGTIEVESTPGAGSAFRITLPAA